MRIGLVGLYTNYRPVEVKGVKYGEIDLIFEGDITWPSESRSIKVLDSDLCRVLVKILADYRKEGKTPLLTLMCWLDLEAREPSITLLSLMGSYERRLS